MFGTLYNLFKKKKKKKKKKGELVRPPIKLNPKNPVSKAILERKKRLKKIMGE